MKQVRHQQRQGLKMVVFREELVKQEASHHLAGTRVRVIFVHPLIL
jgi:hypothetical protein